MWCWICVIVHVELLAGGAEQCEQGGSEGIEQRQVVENVPFHRLPPGRIGCPGDRLMECLPWGSSAAQQSGLYGREAIGPAVRPPVLSGMAGQPPDIRLGSVAAGAPLQGNDRFSPSSARKQPVRFRPTPAAWRPSRSFSRTALLLQTGHSIHRPPGCSGSTAVESRCRRSTDVAVPE